MTMTNEQQMIQQLRDRGYRVDVPKSSDIPDLSKRVAALEQKLGWLERRSGLMHSSWFTRATTAWGYMIAIQLIIGAVILGIGMVLGFFGS
jgi:hypothetical protein